MALEWWEYYEVSHNVKMLMQEIEKLKQEVEKLRGELESMKKGAWKK